MKRGMIAAVLLALAACGAETEPETAVGAEGDMVGEASSTTDAGAALALAEATDPNALYVDVRTPEEFASGHVVGAINIPHDQMEARWEELAEHQDRPVVVYCRTGRRSGIALDVLQQKGFTQVENGGGLDELVAEGMPTTE